MFSFHKPRVYRSTEGCCICRAKSSSSRFTDSRKYEEDSTKCFNLKYPRYGEICNACVLLVKRYKRLPAGSQRHWGHVVDARAGPGTKTITKIKRSKEENTSDNSNTRSNQVQSGKSAISEKFSKIFKKAKNKKSILSVIEERHSVKTVHKSPNKLHSKMTLLKRPNSIDSDNEHSRESSPGPVASPNIVQFQTQTRSSSYRLKNINDKSSHMRSSGINRATTSRQTTPKICGSRRRKKLPPQKNRAPIDSNIKFFDETEWSKRMTCCGIVYECVKLPGTTIIDLDNYKLCEDHQHQQHREMRTAGKGEEKHDTEMIHQKNIKTTLPTIVKLPFHLPYTMGSSANNNPTPVLKKHHLFYKRQSESFPHGDIATTITTQSTTKSKTECNSQAINVLSNNHKSTKPESNLPESMDTSKIQITTICDLALPPNLPRNSNAQVPKFGSPFDKPVSTASDTTNLLGIKSSGFLHRIKSDAGKIVKHSIEKLNSAVRFKAHDLTEMKHVVKTVDKSYILSNTNTTMTRAAQNATTTATFTVPDLSPTSSSSTKFSDNSSDSGFDENVQDRKSVSPLQQENDTKLITRPPVQTLILASGVRVHGQQQNLVYAGNETAAKILQNRIQQQSTVTNNSNNNSVSTILQYNKRLNVQPIALDPSTTLKLVQAKTNSNNVVSIGPYSVGGVKMRALYNNNAIQHENGITTIVPASSLDAIKQTDAIMKTATPNTITITPASSSQIRLPTNSINTNYQYCENKERESIIANALINNNNQNQLNLKNASLNQKIILLKTNENSTFGHNKNASDLM